MLTTIFLFIGQFIGPILGLAQARIEKAGAEATQKHVERLAEIKNKRAEHKADKLFQEARHKAIQAVILGDKGWSPTNIVRTVFAAPFAILTNVVIYAYLIDGTWHDLENMPAIMQNLWMGSGGFYFIYETTNNYQRRRQETKLLTDPGARQLIDETMSSMAFARKDVREGLVKGQ